MARDIAHLHGGELLLRNRQPRGLEAIVTPPPADLAPLILKAIAIVAEAAAAATGFGRLVGLQPLLKIPEGLWERL